MKINQTNKIENNIVSTEITIEALGTTDLTPEKELEILHNFTRKIEYSKIDFTANMKIGENGIPEIVEEEPDGATIAKVTLDDLINKTYPLDEKLNIAFAIDANKIDASKLDEHVFTTKEVLAQALVILFATKIKEDIAEKLAEIRKLNSEFEEPVQYTV